jgi:hypothetical protein
MNTLTGTPALQVYSSNDCLKLVRLFEQWEAEYGLAKAQKDFVTYWTNLPPWAIPKWTCVADDAFVKFFKGKGIDLSTWYGKIISVPFSVTNDALDVVDTVVGNTADVVSNASGLTKILVPVALLTLVGGAAFYLNTMAKNISSKTK